VSSVPGLVVRLLGNLLLDETNPKTGSVSLELDLTDDMEEKGIAIEFREHCGIQPVDCEKLS
jgi:hypothetical protein